MSEIKELLDKMLYNEIQQIATKLGTVFSYTFDTFKMATTVMENWSKTGKVSVENIPENVIKCSQMTSVLMLYRDNQ
jgi:hypothetical protein